MICDDCCSIHVRQHRNHDVSAMVTVLHYAPDIYSLKLGIHAAFCPGLCLSGTHLPGPLIDGSSTSTLLHLAAVQRPVCRTRWMPPPVLERCCTRSLIQDSWVWRVLGAAAGSVEQRSSQRPSPQPGTASAWRRSLPRWTSGWTRLRRRCRATLKLAPTAHTPHPRSRRRPSARPHPHTR